MQDLPRVRCRSRVPPQSGSAPADSGHTPDGRSEAGFIEPGMMHTPLARIVLSVALGWVQVTSGGDAAASAQHAAIV